MSYKKRDLLSPLQGRSTLKTFDNTRPTPDLMRPTLSQSLLLYNENHQDLDNMLNQAEAMLNLLVNDNRANTWTSQLRNHYLQDITTLIHQINTLHHTQWQQHVLLGHYLSEPEASPKEGNETPAEISPEPTTTDTLSRDPRN
jgi:hypothetical protein